MLFKKKYDDVEYLEEEEEKDKVYLWIIFLIASMFLFMIVIGFSYSIFNKTIKGNKVQLENEVIFNYSDGYGSKSVISLKNARDISDDVGKIQSGSGNYFDFNISGKTNGKIKKYMILLEKDEMLSTINDSDIKVYLTKVYGSMEEVLFSSIPTMNNLEEITINGKVYKVLYTSDIKEDSMMSFSDDYIFRMWIRENADDYYGKSYSLKVHVYIEGTGDLCE